jgi:peptidoglycan/xylan/chitin deacetylase (PgdA/CDA1 family)
MLPIPRILAIALLVAAPWGTVSGAQQIALTFDDAPRGDGPVFTGEARAAALIETLDRAGVGGAMFFANSVRLDEEGRRRLAAYAEAGHRIANHSHSHPSLHKVGAEAFLEDVRQAHDELSKLPGYVPYFRFPYLHEGRPEAVRDAVRQGLEALGLKQGYVTVDNYDWYLQALMGEAARANEKLDLEGWKQFYLDVLLDAVAFYDAHARRHLGRSPRHVLLLHENDLAALFIDDLVLALESLGWEVIPAEQAYQDPMAEQMPDTLFLGQGRVAALAHIGGAPVKDLVHPFESEDALRAEAVRRGLLPES